MARKFPWQRGHAEPAAAPPAEPAVTAPGPGTWLDVVTEHHDKHSLLRLRGELDVSNTGQLRAAITSAMESQPPVLVVDLSGLGFTDCAGLSVLVWARQQQNRCGHELVITGDRPIIRRLLQLTGHDAYLRGGSPCAGSCAPA